MAAPSTTPVAMSRPFTRCTPIASIAPAPRDAATDEPDDRCDAAQKRARTSRGCHIGERVTREGLTSQHGEDTHDGRDDGRHQPHEERGAHRVVGEETGFKEPMHPLLDHQFRVFAHQVVVLIARTRDHQDPAVDSQHIDVMAVEGAQYVGSNNLVVVPLATRPLATYTTRSITGSRGFISWADKSTATRLVAVTRSSSSMISWALPGSRLARGSSSNNNSGRLMSACAISTRCCSPPESSPTRRSANRSASTALSISSMSASTARDRRRTP